MVWTVLSYNPDTWNESALWELVSNNSENGGKCLKVGSSGWRRMLGGWMEYHLWQELSINKWQWPRALSVRARESNKGTWVSTAPSEGNTQNSVKMVTQGLQRSIWWDRKEPHTQQLKALWVKTHICTVFKSVQQRRTETHTQHTKKDRDTQTRSVRPIKAQQNSVPNSQMFEELNGKKEIDATISTNPSMGIPLWSDEPNKLSQRLQQIRCLLVFIYQWTACVSEGYDAGDVIWLLDN